jgi:hypothetical protein
MDLITLPKEMIQIEINKWLLEIDRQNLRKVNKYFKNIFCYLSIEFNFIDVQIPHLEKYKKLWNSLTTANIAKWGRVECLKYVRGFGEESCFWGSDTTANAAKYGNLDCLKYAIEGGCLFYNNIIYLIISGGHLECLKYLRSKGCCWDVEAPAYAAYGGYLECLKYILDPNGDGSGEGACPSDNKTILFAAMKNNLECLKYAHSRGCKWDSNVIQWAEMNGSLECLKYARDHGCPEPEN